MLVTNADRWISIKNRTNQGQSFRLGSLLEDNGKR
jgi:hypothetical protein